MPGSDEGVRIADLLSYASTMAQSLGAPEVTLVHLRDAMAVLTGERTMEELLDASRVPFQRANPSLGATGAAQAIAQDWFERLGGTVAGTFSKDEADAFQVEVIQRLAEGAE